MSKTDITKMQLVELRSVRKQDIPFILATWLRGLRFGNNWYKLIHKHVYFTVYHAVIEQILEKPQTTVTIACLKDDPDVILGFVVYENARLHWVYVKQAWRKIGIAKSLVPDTITVVSHLTEVGKALMLKKNLAFNPFFLI